MKLKLAHTNLNDNKVVDLIVEVLRTRNILTHLNLAWTKLTATHLWTISDELADENGFPIKTLRNLNLSYNCLHFDETKYDEPSEYFVENMIEFIKSTKALNHIDISGMNLGRNYNPY